MPVPLKSSFGTQYFIAFLFDKIQTFAKWFHTSLQCLLFTDLLVKQLFSRHAFYASYSEHC